MAEGVAELPPTSFLDCDPDVVLFHLLLANDLHLVCKHAVRRWWDDDDRLSDCCPSLLFPVEPFSFLLLPLSSFSFLILSWAIYWSPSVLFLLDSLLMTFDGIANDLMAKLLTIPRPLHHLGEVFHHFHHISPLQVG